MRKQLLLKIVTLLIVSPLPSILNGQGQECAFTLREAQNLYSQGLIEGIPAMLDDCIAGGFNKEERQQAYKLIILCHLYNDDIEASEQEMAAFLKRYPEYEIVPTDPVEFVFLYETYNTRPVLDLGVFFGGNLTNGNVLNRVPVVSDLKYDYVPVTPGIQAGFMLNYYLTKNFQLSLEPMFFQSTYTLSYENEIQLNSFQLEYQETQLMIALPFSATYEFRFGKIAPYARLGGQVQFLLDSKVDPKVLLWDKVNNQQIREVNVGDIANGEIRNNLYFGIVMGAGLKYKISKGYFFLDTRYVIGLRKVLDDPENRYLDNPDLQEMFWYALLTDSDYRLNNFMFTIGFARTLYNPKKIN